jgi:hypothetical protein
LISETNNDLLLKYLRAWETYDTNLVRQIFEASSVYNVEGKKPLQGLEEICLYWERNRRRQHNLKILPPLKLAITGDTSTFIFCASFVDLEEKEHQTVYGRITLRHPNGKIAELTETYLLDRLPFQQDSLSSEASTPAPQMLARQIARVYWWLKDQSKIAAEFLLTRGTTFFISFMAIVLGYSALLRTLNSHETETAVDAMSDQADVRIDTSKPIDVAVAQLRSTLRRLQMT